MISILQYHGIQWRSFLQRICFFSALICINSIFATDSDHLKKVFSQPALRSQLSSFLDNVLHIVPSPRFCSLVDTILTQTNTHSDQALYAQLLDQVSSIQPLFFQYARLKALQYQREVIAEQIKQLIGNDKQIHGYVEIGTPGTYIQSIKQFASIQDTMYAVYEKSGFSDYIQAFSANPLHGFIAYNRFVPLNAYAPISTADIASDSVDLVVCTIGLHHIPVEKLDNFLDSIYRILRPGGIFILRDHDAHSEDLVSLIYAAHSVYNAIVTQESVAHEIEEYRNFQPISHWISLLEKHGFYVGQERFLQNGDPTLNTLLCAAKPFNSIDEAVAKISNDLKEDQTYQRELIQTYLTAPEWHNVDASQEYAAFIEHTPFYEFPYFESIKSYWHVFGQSWKAARKKASLWQTLSSSYTLMNLFVGTTMTLEYAAKGIISQPIKWVYSAQEPMAIQLLVYDPNNEIERLDSRIKVCHTYEPSSIKRIEMPRYKEFLSIIKMLEHTAIECVEIAGQKQVQIKVRYKDDIDFALIPGCIKEYIWQVPTQKEYTYAACTVEVNKLKDVVKKLIEHSIELLYIHDF